MFGQGPASRYRNDIVGLMERAVASQFIALVFGALTLLLSGAAAAQSTGITYHGRILKPDGSPLESANVQFRIQIRTPNNDNCVLFEETKSLTMAGSNGLFALTINDGQGARTDLPGVPSLSYTLEKLFSNRVPFTGLGGCVSGDGTYTPNSADGRRLQVYFKDDTMGTWEPMPSQALNAVPYAIDARQVAGFPSTSLLRIQDAGGVLGNVAPMTSAQHTELMALIAGSSAQYTRANQLGGSSLPSLGANQSVRWSGSAWQAYTPIATETDPLVQAFAKAALPNCPAGQILTANGTALSCVVDSGGAGTVTSVGVTAPIQNTGSATAVALKIADGTVTGQTLRWNGSAWAAAQLAAGDITGLSASATTNTTVADNISSGTLPAGRLPAFTGDVTSTAGSNTLTLGTVPVTKGGTGLTALGASNQVLGVNAAGDAAEYKAITAGSGVTVTHGANSITIAASGSGGTVTSVGVGGAPLSVTNATTTPTISITQASGATPGFLSAADWTTFNNKLSAVAGSSLNSGQVWVGNSSNQAAAVAVSGDASLSNSGSLSVTGLRGNPVASGSLGAADTGKLLRWDNALPGYQASFVSIADLRKSDGMSQFASASCAAGQTLTWSALTDTMTCANISITKSQVSDLGTIGTAAALNTGTTNGTIPVIGAGDRLPASLIPTGAGSRWNLSGSDINYTAGNVGIGTASPSSALEVNGTVTSTAVSIGGAPLGSNTNLAVNGRTALSWSGSSSTLLITADVAGSQVNTVAEFASRRSGVTPPGSGFGGQVGFLLEGFTNGQIPDAAGIAYGWEAAQTNDTTDRDSFVAFHTMSDNAISEKLRITSSGNVGIGTTAPTSTLSFTGQSAQTIAQERTTGGAAGSDLTLRAAGASSGGTDLDGGDLILSGGLSTGSGRSQIRFQLPNTTNVSGTTDRTLSTKMTLDTHANSGLGMLGLNISNPVSALDVNGGTASDTFSLQGIVRGANLANRFTGLNYVVHGSNYPSALNVAGSVYAKVTQASPLKTEFSLVNNTGNNANIFLFANSDGLVGIGNTNPTQALDVTGNILASGTVRGSQLCIDADCRSSWPSGSGGTVTSVAVGGAPLSVTNPTTTPTISITQASGATPGFLSAADWTTFNNKLSAVAGSSLNSGQVWVGNSSNQAAAVAVSGDASLSNSGALSVTGLRGNPVASGSLGAADTGKLLRWDNALPGYQASFVSIADLRKSDGMSQFASASCAAGQTLTWSVLTDTMTCANISITKSQVSDLGTIGTAAARNTGTTDGTVPLIDATNRLPASLIPTGAGSRWNLSGSDINYTAGNVGIGTTSPSNKLDILGWGITVGADWATGNSRTNGTGKGMYVAFPHYNNSELPSALIMGLNSISGNTVYIGGGTNAVNAATSIRFLTATDNTTPTGTERVTITSSGNVGIATTNPTSLLHINGVPGSSAIAQGLAFGDGDTGIFEVSDDRLRIWVNGTDGVDIGQNYMASPTSRGYHLYKLAGAATNPTYSFTSDTDTGMYSDVADTVRIATASTPRMTIDSSGNVGIGLTNPTYQLQLSTDSAAKPGTSTWTTASDERLKDIRAPFTRGLDDINGLNTIYFNYKKDNPLELPFEKEYVGIKAQDAQKVIPEAVSTDEQGYLHVTNDSIIWTAVNAIKELYAKFLSHDREIASIKAQKADKAVVDAKVQQLEAKNQKLEQENREMKARLDKIEKMLRSK